MIKETQSKENNPPLPESFRLVEKALKSYSIAIISERLCTFLCRTPETKSCQLLNGRNSTKKKGTQVFPHYEKLDGLKWRVETPFRRNFCSRISTRHLDSWHVWHWKQKRWIITPSGLTCTTKYRSPWVHTTAVVYLITMSNWPTSSKPPPSRLQIQTMSELVIHRECHINSWLSLEKIKPGKILCNPPKRVFRGNFLTRGLFVFALQNNILIFLKKLFACIVRCIIGLSQVTWSKTFLPKILILL